LMSNRKRRKLSQERDYMKANGKLPATVVDN
jgi:hypothetical protein